jgi:hypothetical protein
MSLLERLGFSNNAPATEGTPSTAPVPTMLQSAQAQAQAVSQPVPVEPPVTPAPIDPFANLWENTPDTNTPAGLNFNIQPEQLGEIANKMDFSSLIPADIQQRISAGGEDALKAMLEAQNITSRAVFQQSAMATTKLVEAASKNAEERMSAAIEQKFKLLGLKDHLQTTNPALQDPSLKPIVDSVQQQIVKKFPQASSREIQDMRDRYFNEIAGKLAPGMKQASNVSAPAPGAHTAKETDWAAYLFS